MLLRAGVIRVEEDVYVRNNHAEIDRLNWPILIV